MNRLNVAKRPSDTLDSLLERCVPGSCDWVLSDNHFKFFMEDNRVQPLILNISGPPGCGKSVLAAYLVQHLEEAGMPTQFWFFRHDDQVNRSTRQCLLSIAFQIMDSFPEYSHRLLALTEDIDYISRSDLRSLWQKLFLNVLGKLGGYDPIYWVIDAVDECESAQTFLGLLGSLKGTQFPLRLIFLSRSQGITKHFDKLKASLPIGRVSQLSAVTPRDSLELCIAQELEFTPWPDALKVTITDALLRKCQGNFLWLSLVMKELVSCDTAEELEKVLEETPWELLDVYQRIETAVVRDLKPSDSRLIKSILSWVTCSERHLMEAELKEALRPEFSVLNMRHTVSRLCGDFVVMDKTGNVSMVHHTAKEFLTKSANSALAVHPGQAHTFIFNKCLAILTDSRFRIRLKSEGCVGLLRYSCLSWSHHMVRSDETGYNFDIIRRLAAFFKGTACLAWIAAVATTGHLQVLASTAKALTSYLKHAQQAYADENPLAKPLLEIELLNSWSTELVRIVGKFGTNLLQYPQCIYDLVPLFSPPESTLGRQFHMGGPSTPKVTGISVTGWDDCLARFTVEPGRRSKAIYSLDSSFGIVTSNKSVNLYNAFTFQERGKFRHDETIVAADFNQESDLLVTCGIKTIKVWDTMSFRNLYSYANPHGVRAMAVSLSQGGSEIIVCCIDSTLWRQTLHETEDWVQISWHACDEPGSPRGRSGGGTPICTSFSPDGLKVVVAYRTAPVAIWGTESGNLIGRLESRHINQNMDYPVRLTWNRVTEHVVGIFTSGTIFKWYPLDLEHEVMETNVMATEIACSPDGKLIVTSQRDGSLKIFSFDNFTLLYNLTCMSRATAIAVSPDGRRIYDIRQSYCNVWEPNALIRMAEQDDVDRSSDTASSQYDPSVQGSVVSEAAAGILEPVTALCTNVGSTAYAFGNDSGTLSYYPPGDATTQSPEGVNIPCGLLSISCIAMDQSGQFIAAASMDRKITIRRILQGGEIQVDAMFEARTDMPVTQLLFDISGQYLAIKCQQAVDIWSIATKSLVRGGINDDGGSRTIWISHPSQPQAFISIGALNMILYHAYDQTISEQWKLDTSEIDKLPSPPALFRRRSSAWQLHPDDTESTVDHVLMTPDQSDILVQMSRVSTSSTHNRHTTFMLLKTKFPISTKAISAKPLPKSILSLMELPLGFVLSITDARPAPSGQTDQLYSLAFIDREFWIRTWDLHNDSDGTASKKHFFLPRDWINMECLELAQVTVDGRFLCPRNSEVAVVHRGLKGLGWPAAWLRN